MRGMIPESVGLMPLLALGVLIAAALLGSLAVHAWLAFWLAWARFWDAARMWVYLQKPWRVAWDQARRRIS